MNDKIFELLGRKEFENALLRGQVQEFTKTIADLQKQIVALTEVPKNN